MRYYSICRPLSVPASAENRLALALVVPRDRLIAREAVLNPLKAPVPGRVQWGRQSFGLVGQHSRT